MRSFLLTLADRDAGVRRVPPRRPLLCAHWIARRASASEDSRGNPTHLTCEGQGTRPAGGHLLSALASSKRATPRTARAGKRKVPICRYFLGVARPGSATRVLPRNAHHTPRQATEVPISRHFEGTGATGLEPATSGVTGRARVLTILYATPRKRPNSRNFRSVFAARSNGFPRRSLTGSPHLRPITASQRQAHLQELSSPASQALATETTRSSTS
jgi:hypothetical protein